MIIAIDGPASAGKGTVAKIISEKLDLNYLDTGITYRTLALKCLNNNISDEKEIIKLSENLNLDIKNNKVYLDNIDVTDKIRTYEVSSMASNVSKIVKVRENLTNLQRQIANGKNVIVEGRDTTTVLFPNATYKFYLDASLDVRAKRRYDENPSISLDDVKKQMEERDYQDMHKEVGSLTRTKDQIYIDTSNMTINEVVDKILEVIK